MSLIRKQVSPENLMRHTTEIARTVRLSGTEGEAAALDYLSDVLSGFGYEVQRHHNSALIGYPLSSSMEVVAPERFEVPCNGFALSPSTPLGGIEAEVIHVPGGPAEIRAADAAGKIVIADGIAYGSAVTAATEAGAVGLIFDDGPRIHEMCISPVWGTPTPATAHLLPKLPSVAILGADGQRIKALLARGPVRVRFETKPFREWTDIPTLIADLPGHGGDRFVMFSGHIDSWHYGAMDNGTANATQVEVGRILADRRNHLRHGVRLAFWSGHSHGRYAGSTWYADAYFRDLRSRCIANVNVDSVGGKGAVDLTRAETMAETYGFARDVLASTLAVDLGYHRFGRHSDQSFWGVGIPSIFSMLSTQPVPKPGEEDVTQELLGGGGLGWWWHTPEDTVDKIDPDFLARDATVFTEVMLRLTTDERIPFDPSAGAEEIARHAARYADLSGHRVDLRPVVHSAMALVERLRGADLEQMPAPAANDLIQAVLRLTIPVNYTQHGPYDQDLAVDLPAMPGLQRAVKLASLDPASDESRFLATAVLRERNRVEDALWAACEQVDLRTR